MGLINDRLKNQHLEKFPYNDNLMALIFMITSNLNEQQRTLLQTHCTLHGWKIQEYTFDTMRTLFMELLTAPKSSLEDPNVRPRSDFRGHRSFMVLDEIGELEGTTGYWVEDQETGVEGFVNEFEDEFWVFDDQSSFWQKAGFKGRSFVKGKGKGKSKRKGSGKGGKGRRFFKPRRFGKGRSHAVAEENSNDEWTNAAADAFFKGGGKKGKGKGKFKGKAFFKGKGGKSKGKGKGKPKGADDASADAAQLEAPPDQQYTDEEWNSYDWSQSEVDWSTTDAWFGKDVVTSDQWSEDSWYASNYGSTFLVFPQWETVKEVPFKAYSSMASSPSFASTLLGKTEWEIAKERWQATKPKVPIDLRQNPGHVILDLGCTKSMGSLRAVNAFIDYAWYFGIWVEWLPCNTKMSFANSQTTTLKWCVRMHFPTNPPISTIVDVHEEGDIPILFSLPQMMNLGFKLDLNETECRLTCHAFGYNHVTLDFCTSRHIVLDLCTIQRNLTQAGLKSSFAVSNETEDDTSLGDTSYLTGETADADGVRLHEKTSKNDPRAKAYPKPPVASSRQEGEQIAKDLEEALRPDPKAKAKAKPRQRGDPDDPMPGIGEHGGPGPGGLKKRRRDSKPGKPIEVPDNLDMSEPLVEVPEGDLSEGDKVKKVLQKIHARLRDNGELLKIHLKHYHMTTDNFKRRTTQLKIPNDIYEQYEKIVKACESCQRWCQAPTRSRISGMRAVNFGDLIFVDHVDITIDEYTYCVLIVLDAASNLIWAGCQKSKLHEETMRCMRVNWDEWNVRPKAIVADNYFMEPDFKKWYSYNGIKPIELGANTPWPNRAEAAVKLFKHYAQILVDSVRHYAETDPGMKNVTVRHMFLRATWARNNAVTYGGKTPLEIATGRRPPDVLDLESMMPKQLATEPTASQQSDDTVRKLATMAHLEARQREDIRSDLAQRLRSSDGPFSPGQGVWYWDRDASKIRGGEWVKARVTRQGKPPMVTLDLAGQEVTVNQSKIRKNPDPWHDVVIPGVDGRDDYCTVPGQPEQNPEQLVEAPATPLNAKDSGGPLPAPLPAPEYDVLEEEFMTWSRQLAEAESHAPVFWVRGDAWLGENAPVGAVTQVQPFWFKQYCTSNDKLSAVVGQYKRAGSPVFLDHTFVSTNELRALQEHRPKTVWINADERNSIAAFCYHAATLQAKGQRTFVITLPWKSSLWTNPWIVALLTVPGVRTEQVDMNSYTPMPCSWPGTVCMITNMTNLDSLNKGSYAHKPLTYSYKAERFSDDYPIAFCQNVYLCISEADRSPDMTEWPIQNPVQRGLVVDLLSDLQTEDLQILDKACTTELQPGILHQEQVCDVQEVLAAEPHLVVNSKVKSIVTWLNSRPQGTIVDMTTRENQSYYPKVMEGLVSLRKTYFPMAVYTHCRVYRGVIDDIPSTIAGQPDDAVVFMWKKDSNVKRIFASKIHFMRFGNFNAKPWSIVVMYNLSGTSSGRSRDYDGHVPVPAPRSHFDKPDDDDHDMKPPDSPGDNGDEDMPEPFRHPPPPDYYDPDKPVPQLRQVKQESGVDPKRERSRSRENRPDPYRYPSPPPSEPDDGPPPFMESEDEDGVEHDIDPPHGEVKRERSRSRDDPPSTPLRERSRSRDDDQEARRRPAEREPARFRIHTPDVTRTLTGNKAKNEPRQQPSSSSASGSRPTAVKSMARPGHGCNIPRPRQVKKEEPAEEANVSDTDFYCGACAVLSLRGDDKCSACATGSSTQAQKKKPQGFKSYMTHWCAATYQNDLHIMTDDESWSNTPDVFKLAAKTDSFSFVTDYDDSIIDLSSMDSNPATNTALYLNNSWHSYATLEEVCADIEHEPLHVRAEVLRAVKSATPKRKAARSEANAQQKREYAKQFLKAKQDEYQSWKENDVFEIIDMRKEKCPNFVTGRWVLTVKKDKEGNFQKCKARWVLRGFQDSQIWNLQTDSPTSTRPGFRLQCQAAANNDWDLTHIDLKTAFLQGEEYDSKRDVVCQLPPEAGLPDYMGARLKRAAYGLNDAPRLWFNKLDKKLTSYGLVPTRADRCCYVLYSEKKKAHFQSDEVIDCSPEHLGPSIWEANLSSAFRALDIKSQSQAKDLDIDGALELLLDPITGSKAHGKTVEGIVTIHVDDCFMCGTDKFMRDVVGKLRKDFQVGSEDKNDIMFVGQRIRWVNKGKPGSFIQVDQEKKVEELGEVTVDASLRDNLPCTPDYHKQFRSVLGQINWLQSRTQFQSCYLFSRSASACAGPTYGDLRALNKLVRKIRAEVVKLQYWKLSGHCRIVGYPDAAYRNNADKSSQRGQVIFIAEPRKPGTVNPRGSLVDYESQKIKRTVLSTTVSELYAFMKCYGTCQFLRGLWMDLSAEVAEVHMRTDANNLVTTASTTHLPEQKETIHMINQLRTEAISGQIDDLAHVISVDCLADCLTKASADSKYLIKAITTGYLPNVDKHPPFRDLMKGRHKAYESVAHWIAQNLPVAPEVTTFLGTYIGPEVQRCLALTDWYADTW